MILPGNDRATRWKESGSLNDLMEGYPPNANIKLLHKQGKSFSSSTPENWGLFVTALSLP